MYLPVLEHVPDRIGGLARRGEQLRVVAVGKHRALPAHHLVERARHPDFQPLHRPAQRLRVGGLDDEVRVVALHREVHQAEPEPLAAALECAPIKVRVNAVCPGDTLVDRWIEKGYFESSDPVKVEEAMKESSAYLPMGRFGKPEEIAQAVLFLASDDSSFVTGHLLLVDGGNTAQ